VEEGYERAGERFAATYLALTRETASAA